MSAEDIRYCADAVRRHDDDLFLLAQASPADIRPSVLAIFAFAAEIERVRASVTDTTLGLIRLQWWRDEIGRIYQNSAQGTVQPAPAHPVLRGLADAINPHALPLDLFETFIYAHEFDVEDRQAADMAGLKAYAALTSVPLIRLALMGRIIAKTDEERLERLATAFGLMRLIHAMPSMLRAGWCPVPQGLLTRHGLQDKAQFGAAGFQDSYEAVLTDLAKVARDEIDGFSFENNLLKSFFIVTHENLRSFNARSMGLQSEQARARKLFKLWLNSIF